MWAAWGSWLPCELRPAPAGLSGWKKSAQEATAAGRGTVNRLCSDAVRSPAHRPNLSQVLRGLKGKSFQEALTCQLQLTLPSPTCYPIWPGNHSTYRGAGTVTERPAGSGQMPLPIKLWGRLPKKGHIKMESVHPTLKSRGLSERLGLMRAAHTGLLNNYLDFPLENHSPNSLLAAERHHFQQNGVCPRCRGHPTDTCKLCHKGHCPGETPHNVNAMSLSTLAFSVRCSWSQKLQGHSSKDTASILFSSHFVPTVSFSSSLCQSNPYSLSLSLLFRIQTSVSHVPQDTFSLHLFYILICQEDFVALYML